MKPITLSLVIYATLFSGMAARACPRCRPFVDAGVYNQDFGVHLSVVLLPIVVLLGIAIALYFVDALPKAFRG